MPDLLRFAVIGHPVGHSRSPEIHAAFAAQSGIALTYDRLDAKPAEFADRVRRFFDEGGSGLNVTLPHKPEAARLADDLSARASRAGAVNTLSMSGARLAGDNTDGVGLYRDLVRVAKDDVLHASILVIGAGGAAQGALSGLIDAGCERLAVAARDDAKAHLLAGRFSRERCVKVVAWESGSGAEQFDIVINATAAGIRGETLEIQDGWLAATGLAYDLAYGDRHGSRLPFLAHARSQGVACVEDGIGMLVEQAAESFFVWHGIRPDVVPVLAQLKAR